MTIALSEFWTNLVQAGVVSAEDCRQIASRCSQANQGRIVSDPVLVAKYMIATGLLNEFQARSLLSKPPKPIRYGRFLQKSESIVSPLSQWIDVRSIDDRTDGWLTRIAVAQIDHSNRQWLADHQRAGAPSLQPIRCSSSSPETIEVFSDLPSGRCLFDVLAKSSKIDPRRAVEIGIQLTQALAIVHEQGLVHGGVRADRVWIADSKEIILLREPIRWSLTPRTFGEGPWLDDLELAAAYAAPELAQANVSCDALTDIYSVGCLLYRMITGQTPFHAKSPQVLMAAHMHETLPELATAVSQGASGNPCFRVIAFAMAKNREARFASAKHLATALQAILPLLPEKATQVQIPIVSEKVDESERTTAAVQKKVALPKALPPVVKKTPTLPAQDFVAARPAEQSPVERSPVEQVTTVTDPATTMSDPRTSERVMPTRTTSTQPIPPAAALPVEPSPATPPPADSSPEKSSPEKSSPAESPRRRRRTKKKSVAPLILGGLGVAALLLVVALLVHEPKAPEKNAAAWRPAPTVIPSVGGGGVAPITNSTKTLPDDSVAKTADGRYTLIDDDRLLFAPPVSHGSEPASMELLPPGPGMIVSARLASLDQSAGGVSITATLGPDVVHLFELAASRAGVTVDEIERCTAALHAGKDGWPSVSLVVSLVHPKPFSELLEIWKVSASKTPEGATIYTGDEPDGDAFFVEASEAENKSAPTIVSRFAIGSIDRMREVAELNGAAIPLPQAMDKLWRTSTARADLFALITPNFLLADGRSMLQATAPRMVEPLKSFLIPDISSTQIIATVEEDRVYVELRMIPSGDLTDAALRERLRTTLQTWPKWADDFVVGSVPDSSWRLLANRLPAMTRFLVDQTRDGLSDSTVVANAYLPTTGAAQLILAALLAINAPQGPDLATTHAVQSQAETLTVKQMLDRKMSVAFAQESLEFAIHTIVEEFQSTLPKGVVLPPVQIIGGDLELMGITQNQQIRDFSKSDVPLRSVLTDLLVGANPDKTASGPTDPKQALIWVVVDDDDTESGPRILITTREAAKGKYEIPPEFVSQP